jgi:vacuolar-type H+-ATPase subunit D/Vma8
VDKFLTPEELLLLKQLSNQREKIKIQLGNLEYELQLLKKEKNKVIQNLQNLEENCSKIANELQKKYGEGALNLKTGEFKTY